MDKISLMNIAREKRRQGYHARLKAQAKKYFHEHENDPRFIAGIMLYWAEGKTTDREKSILELNNTNPQLLRLYCNFLRRHLRINNKQLRARLFLYPDLEEKRCKLFWSSLLGIPQAQFIKSYVSCSRSFVTKSKLPYGTCSVYVTSTALRIIMSVWIEEFAALYG